MTDSPPPIYVVFLFLWSVIRRSSRTRGKIINRWLSCRQGGGGSARGGGCQLAATDGSGSSPLLFLPSAPFSVRSANQTRQETGYMNELQGYERVAYTGIHIPGTQLKMYVHLSVQPDTSNVRRIYPVYSGMYTTASMICTLVSIKMVPPVV